MSPEQRVLTPATSNGHDQNGHAEKPPGTSGTPAGSPAKPEGGALFKVTTLLLGGLCGVLIFAALLLWLSARDSERAAELAAAGSGGAAVMSHDATGSPGEGARATASFAGIAPANATDLAAAHKPFPAELPAATPGPVLKVTIPINHAVFDIAPGVKYQAWTFGDAAPGPVIHARQGQRVEVTMRNDSPIPHSIDFHAARIAPNVAFRDIAPGESFSFSFVAGDPGVYMYHCGTKPVLAHIANGMYGAIVVSPPNLPKADREYVLVSSEWYLNNPGLEQPAGLDMVKANNAAPDWVTWNGYAAQYVTHPLEAEPNEVVRFWVVAAGPSLGSAFHVVGTVFNRAWVNQDMTQYQVGPQTVQVPAGGGGVFDVQIPDVGLYPIVSHEFRSPNMGQVGLLKVGDPEGSMSH